MIILKILIALAFAFSSSSHASCVNLFEEYFNNIRTIHKSNSIFPVSPKRYRMINEDGKSLLIGKKGDENLLLRVVDELKSVRNISDQSVVVTNNDSIYIDITKYIDKRINFLFDKTSMYGANCWNFACFATGAVKGISFTSPKEFNFLLKSPLAVEVKSIDELRSGDLIAIRSSTSESSRSEVHGSTYLTPNLWLSKAGVDSDARYEIADSLYIASEYEKYNGKVMNAFRMKKLDVYLEENLENISDELMDLYNEFRMMEIHFHRLYLGLDGRYREPRDNAQNLLNTFQNEFYVYTISKPILNKEMNEAEDFLIEYISLRVDSIESIEISFR